MLDFALGSNFGPGDADMVRFLYNYAWVVVGKVWHGTLHEVMWTVQ